MTEQDWIREGATVVEYSHQFNAPDGITRAKVAKLTKTQIVLDNERRYRRNDLRLVGQVHNYSGYNELVPPNDPRIRDVIAERKLRALVHRIEQIPRTAYGKGADGVLAALDEMEKGIRATRAAITGKEA
ncbi:hypothetical protein [Micromonospora sp. CA-248212]|uniref:hypothetical protein n=1 Tax=Micromonospora sp. CA-248212 TaxID=3239961 RepID=UPI003D8CEFE3